MSATAALRRIVAPRSCRFGLILLLLHCGAVAVVLVLLHAVVLLPLLLIVLTTRRKVLFIIASEIVEGSFIYFDVASGHLLYVFYDNLVAGVLLIVFITFRPHVPRQTVYGVCNLLLVAVADQTLQLLLHIFAVMFVCYGTLRVWQPAGRYHQIVPRGAGIGRIHIEFEIRHYEQVVPQFVGEVGSVAQQRIEIAHYGYYGSCLTIAFAAVFDVHQQVHHLLYVTPVFGQEKFFPCVVIVLFHKIRYALRPKQRSRRRSPSCEKKPAVIDLLRLVTVCRSVFEARLCT